MVLIVFVLGGMCISVVAYIFGAIRFMQAHRTEN